MSRIKEMLARLHGTVKDRLPRRTEPTLDPPAEAPPVAPVKQDPPAPPRIDHGEVRRADPYAFEVAHQRLAWLLRLSVMINVGLGAVVVVEGATISELVPLQHLQLGLIRIEPSSSKVVRVDPADLVRIEPITTSTPGYYLLMDAFVRRYVSQLLTIDRVSQDDRMRECNIFSDADFWQKFIKLRLKPIQDAIKGGLNRSIVVTSSDVVSRRGGVSIYAVDIDQTDERDGKTEQVKQLRAYVRVTARPQLVPPSEEFENPAGFAVLDLVLKERGKQ